MKVNFTLFLTCTLLSLLTIGNSASAQTAGDFRTNGTGGGSWTLASTWQTFDGTTWNAATASPDAASAGIITVLSGDSVALLSAITIDQVVVNSGGALAMGGSVTITLGNVPATNAIDNSGRVYIASNGILSGTGTFRNESGALLKIMNGSTINVTTNNIAGGEVRFSGTASGVAGGVTLTNNGLINWEQGNLFIQDGSTIANSDSMAILPNTSIGLNSNTGGTLTNPTGGVIYLKDPALVLTAASNISFSNSGGRVRGFGSASFPGTSSNTGSIIPGDDNAAATLTLSGNIATTGSPTYVINLVSAGGVAGTNYSQVALANSVNLGSSTLTVNDQANSDPVGQTYTLMTAPSFTGTFATTNLPPTLGNLTVSGGTVTLQRTGTLPLTWGSFNVRAAGSEAILNWTTLQESNTDAFIIERSTDAINFSPIGTVKAGGNTNKATAYTFTDDSPSQLGYNYYRLQQRDLDGKKSYSSIEVIGFGSKNAVFVQTSPNPVKDLLNITVQADNVMIAVTDMNGRYVKLLRLNRGFHQSSTSDLAPGVYRLTFYQGNKKIGGQQLIKL
ncbi:MAG: T9SS type A sorting domain-containing protein [Bacteroidetes bacterium]|nr:T9SS type A sorting domain-containing protein [Bacteroidota bacterium]